MFFSSLVKTRKSRPWLMALLLPYLVFGVWASPFHIHTPDGREMSMSALSEVISENHSPWHTQNRIKKTSDTQDAGDCLLCDWNAHASALLVCVAALRPSINTQLVSFEAPPLPLSLFRRNARSRGPPHLS